MARCGGNDGKVIMIMVLYLYTVVVGVLTFSLIMRNLNGLYYKIKENSN